MNRGSVEQWVLVCNRRAIQRANLKKLKSSGTILFRPSLPLGSDVLKKMV